MPPSPSLSTRMANVTYLIVTTTIRVQMMSESEPTMAAGSGLLPVSASTVLRV